MSIDKYNSEGYYDPTAYEALSLIEKEERALRAFRPIVYICSPFSGDVEGNVKAAQGYHRFKRYLGDVYSKRITDSRNVYPLSYQRNRCIGCSLCLCSQRHSKEKQPADCPGDSLSCVWRFELQCHPAFHDYNRH